MQMSSSYLHRDFKAKLLEFLYLRVLLNRSVPLLDHVAMGKKRNNNEMSLKFKRNTVKTIRQRDSGSKWKKNFTMTHTHTPSHTHTDFKFLFGWRNLPN